MSRSPVPQRPILAGNGLGGGYVLDLLLEAYGPQDLLVIAPPETERHDWQPSLAELAQQRSVTVVQAERVNEPEVLAQIVDHRCDLLLSVLYTQIFRPELLDAIQGPAINFHPALLPRHRGTAPLIWAIVEGDEMAGVSIHELTPGIDTGELVYQRKFAIHPDDTGYTLHLKSANMMRAAAAGLLRSLLRGDGLPPSTEQGGPASYHSRRDPRVNHLDFADPRERIRNIVRALAPPLPGAYAVLDGRRVVVARVEYAEGRVRPRVAGTVEFDRTSGEAFVWAVDGPLELCEAIVDGQTLRGPELARQLDITDGVALR